MTSGALLQDSLGLDIELPIIQAPMAGVQDSRLAIAVADAGGLGSLPCAMLSVNAMAREIQAIRSASERPFNVNFFCHRPPLVNQEKERAWRKMLRPYYEEFGIDENSISSAVSRAPFNADCCDALEEFQPPVVSFHFGLPGADLVKRVKSWGSKVLSSATTVDEARWLESNGVDAVIAQGVEAGGHRGMFLSDDISTQVSTMPLLAQILKAVSVPVVAAGGIGDPDTVARLLQSGAAGVQIGTGYLLSHEATTSEVHRAALAGEAAGHTVLTNLFTGRPARAIRNRLIDELGPFVDSLPEFPAAAAALAPLRSRAKQQGCGDFSSMWCGDNSDACAPLSAAAITRNFAAAIS